MPDTRIGAALLEAARAFRPRLIADRDRIEAARRIPEDLAQELARAGFFRLLLPEAYGGVGFPPLGGVGGVLGVGGAEASGAWGGGEGNTPLTAAPPSPPGGRTIPPTPP